MSPSKRHILFVENAPGFGGSTRCVLDLSKACADRGHRVTLAISTPLPDGEQAPAGVNLLNVRQTIHQPNLDKQPRSRRWQRWTDWLTVDGPAARRLARFIREHHVDLIHANNELLSNRVAILAGRMSGTPVISHQRGWGRRNLATRFLVRGVDRFVAISNAVARDMAANGIPSDRTTRIYDGIRIEDFTASPTAGAAARARLGLEPGEFVVALPAVLTPWKGHRLFLDAFARFAGHVPAARALIIGGVLAEGRSYERELHERCRALDIDRRVVFAGHQAAIAAWYHAADLVVHTSLAPEPLGLVVLEAMAAGRAVVASNAGGPAEIITHGRDGWLYPMGDATALAQAMRLLHADRALLRRIATAATRRSGDFGLDNCDAAIADLHEAVLRDSSCRRRGIMWWPSRRSSSSSASLPPASGPCTSP